MRRRTQRALIQLVFFGSVLFLVIFLTRSGSSSKTFAWTKIRYRTTAATLPEARGICAGLAKSSRPALVVSRVTADDSKWLEKLGKKYHQCVYTADAPADLKSTNLQVPANRGHEAMAYLTFLIDNYDHIPAAGAVFVHGSRWAWHNDAPDYDNAALLAQLNITAALEISGYHNLRCDWSISTCPASTKAQGSIEMTMQAVLVPYDERAVSDAMLPRALANIFGGNEPALAKPGRGDAVRSQCCAQFVVARESIWQHSRDEYVALRQWLLDGTSTGQQVQRTPAAPPDDRIAGRILSYVWHILYIKQDAADAQNPASAGLGLERLNALACPSAQECYCRLYGRCNLDGCQAGKCSGQYRLPKDLKLPADWATTHS
ncbi:uncharacterized protein LY89DRAFT_614045 [Mollisia scopiformis]|uniref:Uncharacterized protein n=1 Tax=Mollisia scopiformis TaxID=149040 RepID=A0A194XFD9_MOLSC|nr:uncharacterized protein LY89DRAFT_614045 [Mollisia scopiformis]KUJ18910.1 hypothetical protein LY89DRAFT_614045 [Mollisia scopiformis]